MITLLDVMFLLDAAACIREMQTPLVQQRVRLLFSFPLIGWVEEIKVNAMLVEWRASFSTTST